MRTDAGREQRWKYAWDPFGMLRSVERPDGLRIEFAYDAFARRVSKRTVREGQVLTRTHYIWDLASLLHEVRLGPSGEPESVRTYLYEDPQDPMPLGHQDSARAGWVYYVEDVIGTPTELVDAQGQLLGRLERTTFGQAKATAGAKDTTQFRFPGQYEDQETGLHYNRFRYYDPEVGRYISPDPIGYFGGLNLYAYGPNPIGYQDLLGLMTAQLLKAPESFREFNKQRTSYSSSGIASPGLNTAPTECEKRNNGCAEQKFANDLMKFGEKDKARNTQRRERKCTLCGKYPPCPVCHGAMMRAAADTNSTVNYQWEQPKGRMNQVTYDGRGDGTCRVTAEGSAGNAVATGYDHTLEHAANRRAPQTVQQYWGVKYSAESDKTYESLKERKKKGG